LTTVPQQQLFTLNSKFISQQAKALVARISTTNLDEEARIDQTFHLVFGRAPSPEELRLGHRFLNVVSAPGGRGSRRADTRPNNGSAGASPSQKPVLNTRQKTTNQASLSLWEQYCQVLLSSNEFLYRP